MFPVGWRVKWQLRLGRSSQYTHILAWKFMVTSTSIIGCPTLTKVDNESTFHRSRMFPSDSELL